MMRNWKIFRNLLLVFVWTELFLILFDLVKPFVFKRKKMLWQLLRQYQDKLFESYMRPVAQNNIPSLSAKMIILISQLQILAYYFHPGFAWYLNDIFDSPQVVLQFLRLVNFFSADELWIIFVIWFFVLVNFAITLTLFIWDRKSDILTWLVRYFNFT